MNTGRNLKSFIWWELTVPLAVLVLATTWIAMSGWDLRLAGRFYSPTQAWSGGEVPPWSWLYRCGSWPAIALAVGGAIMLLASVWVRPWRHSWRAMLFFPLVMILGPGLIVNGILKNEWGRPRPRQLTQFGGRETYRTPLEPDWGKPDRHSFPSGHASMGFFLLTPFFLLRRSRPTAAKGWLVAGLAWGLIMGLARMKQGGHFFTDALWAGGVVYFTGAIVAFFLLHPAVATRAKISRSEHAENRGGERGAKKA